MTVFLAYSAEWTAAGQTLCLYAASEQESFILIVGRTDSHFEQVSTSCRFGRTVFHRAN